MIPGIEDILRMLLAGDIDQAQAQSWIDRHIEMAAEMDGLRDHLAGEALRLVAAVTWHDLGFKPVDGLSIMENNALCAYQQADAMVKARAAS